jgi:hypothetical protein
MKTFSFSLEKAGLANDRRETKTVRRELLFNGLNFICVFFSLIVCEISPDWRFQKLLSGIRRQRSRSDHQGSQETRLGTPRPFNRTMVVEIPGEKRHQIMRL